ncbi:MAG: four-helix bundle copper-binding protein [Pseudobacteriovorax sp.]|nr:four-helix bundle copper-binding protein [Pseudobacteriovorax sp.]
MNRRDLIAGSGAVLVGAAMSGTLLAEDPHKDHKHHKHHKHKKAKPRVISKQEKAVFASLEDCLSTGKLCVSHCMRLIEVGDTAMLECQRVVMDMIAVTESLQTVMGYGSAKKSRIKSLIKACQEFCLDCEKECKKHADHHKECADCAKACRDYAKASASYLKTI